MIATDLLNFLSQFFENKSVALVLLNSSMSTLTSFELGVLKSGDAEMF